MLTDSRGQPLEVGCAVVVAYGFDAGSMELVGGCPAVVPLCKPECSVIVVDWPGTETGPIVLNHTDGSRWDEDKPTSNYYHIYRLYEGE